MRAERARPFGEASGAPLFLPLRRRVGVLVVRPDTSVQALSGLPGLRP